MTPLSPFAYGSDRAVVGRVRVAADGSLDANSARLRLERALDGDALRVPGLAPEAVLCVRALRDPRPGVLSLERIESAPPAWRGAMHAALAREAQAAARPIEGPVCASATGVLFRDRSEMLACIARDWVQGTVGANWWWRHLRRSATSRVAPAEWLADPRYVPAAARLLADRGVLGAFAGKLEEREAAALVHAVAAAFGIDLMEGASGAAGAAASAEGEVDGPSGPFSVRPSSPRGLLASLSSPNEHSPRPSSPSAFSPRRSAPGTLAVRPSSPGPLSHEGGGGDSDENFRQSVRPAPSVDSGSWARWAPEALTDALHAPARAFVLLSIALVRAPAVARDREVVGAIASWVGVGPRAASPQRPHADASAQRRAESASATRSDEPPTARKSAATEAFADGGGASSARAPTASVRQESEENAGSFAARVDDAEFPRGRQEVVPAPPVHADLPPRARLTAEPAKGAWTSTRYGGVFFLINALLALEVYADFTRPKARTLRISPWRVLAAIGGLLLGSERAADDPLWALLDELRGPDDETAWPDAWRVPVQWLKPFPEREGWTWLVANGRLLVEHPAGFAVVDVPCEGDVEAQCAQELSAYGVEAREGANPQRAGGSWVSALASFLRARVHRALRGDSEDASVALLLRLPARVRVTETRVDVHMLLADLPVEIRFAGLDRDPGWVPAAGRFLGFHFE